VTPIKVTTCTEAALRAAINAAKADDTIQLSMSQVCTITLTGGPIVISKNLTLDASGSPKPVTLSGNDQVQVLQVNTGITFTLSALIVTHSRGSGIVNNGGTVTLGYTIINNNSDSGFEDHGGKVVIGYTVITGNKGSGIENSGGKIVIGYTVIVSNGGHSIVNTGGGTVSASNSVIAD
jgi:hypothetical protein